MASQNSTCGKEFSAPIKILKETTIINDHQKVRQSKPSRVLDYEPSSPVAVGEARDAEQGEARAHGAAPRPPVASCSPRGGGSLSTAQEIGSGKPTNSPRWKLEKETDVLIK